MRWQWCVAAALIAGAAPLEAASAKIKKVLPHRVDLQGRHTPAPSLYERDAYQAHLRAHPEECGGLRFDVLWRAPRAAGNDLRLRVELRGSGQAQALVVEERVKRRRWFSRWSGLRLGGESYRQLGELIAWRVTLWNGEQLLAEERSFLW